MISLIEFNLSNKSEQTQMIIDSNTKIYRLNNIINELQSRIEDIRRNVIKCIEKIYNIEDYSELITIKNICEEELK